MRAFDAVVREGSFTAVAERLETDKARISRSVRRIEEQLGVRLLIRSARHLSITEVGRDYFELKRLRCKDALQAFMSRRRSLCPRLAS
ncbi:LysR family transcriptional regulator [Rhizobium sp. BUS002]|uniref:LysR family transcriptional regulator n=2 Tax=Rhizobium/Agrobacterium group TaxID=227290 RepID=A0A7X6FA00_9HYPH|nr:MULTISPECIES: LysR family transcriptional regulator [Rhizobium]MDE8763044.1 LysR family transcriptional regulator [Rhizobium sp. CBK13]NKF13339.1 LysR family transcriptional regulator [Rhizobium phaseoli]QPK13243.1 LysR family transcriptional regulator [Rhizobium phaseoli]